MKTYDLYKLAIKLLSRLEKEEPKRSYTNKAGESATVTDVIDTLKKTSSWMYPDLSTDDIAKVIRCKNCKYYRKYKKKGDLKSSAFYACSQDMRKRPPDFFCKDGDEP